MKQPMDIGQHFPVIGKRAGEERSDMRDGAQKVLSTKSTMGFTTK